MARIPTINTSQPTGVFGRNTNTQLTPLSSSIPLSPYGNAIEQASNIASFTADAMKSIQEENDKVLLLNAQNKYKRDMIKDISDGQSKMKGLNAQEFVSYVQKQSEFNANAPFSSEQKDPEAIQLPERQRENWNAFVDSQRTAEFAISVNYTAQQQEIAYQDALKSNLNLTASTVIQSGFEKTSVETGIKDIYSTLNVDGNRNGLSQESVDSNFYSTMQPTIEAYATNLINKSPIQAANYLLSDMSSVVLSKDGEKIPILSFLSGEQKEKVMKSLKTAVIQQTANVVGKQKASSEENLRRGGQGFSQKTDVSVLDINGLWGSEAEKKEAYAKVLETSDEIASSIILTNETVSRERINEKASEYQFEINKNQSEEITEDFFKKERAKAIGNEEALRLINTFEKISKDNYLEEEKNNQIKIAQEEIDALKAEEPEDFFDFEYLDKLSKMEENLEILQNKENKKSLDYAFSNNEILSVVRGVEQSGVPDFRRILDSRFFNDASPSTQKLVLEKMATLRDFEQTKKAVASTGFDYEAEIKKSYDNIIQTSAQKVDFNEYKYLMQRKVMNEKDKFLKSPRMTLMEFSGSTLVQLSTNSEEYNEMRQLIIDANNKKANEDSLPVTEYIIGKLSGNSNKRATVAGLLLSGNIYEAVIYNEQ